MHSRLFFNCLSSISKGSVSWADRVVSACCIQQDGRTLAWLILYIVITRKRRTYSTWQSHRPYLSKFNFTPLRYATHALVEIRANQNDSERQSSEATF